MLFKKNTRFILLRKRYAIHAKKQKKIPPALKWWGPPKRQGLCSQSAHLWATADPPPSLKRWGPPDRKGYVAKPYRHGHLVDASTVASWNKMLQKIEKGKSLQGKDFMSIHRLNAECCTCPMYGVYAMCEGVLLWHMVNSMCPPSTPWS